MRESVRSAALWAGALAAAMSAGIVAEVTPAATGAARSVSAAVVAPQSHSPALSGNGRFLAFVTDAALVTADTNAVADVYVRNLSTGTTVRASVGRNGGPANRASSEPSLSADGRYAVFTSAATNLVLGDTNGVADVFRRDLQTNTTTLVSLTNAERLAGSASGSATISANGNLVAFDSLARLTTTDTDNVSDVFVRAIGVGTTTELSRRATVPDYDPPASTSGGRDPWISDNGRYVSFAGPLTTEFDTGTVAVRHDRSTGLRDYPCGSGSHFGICRDPVVQSADGQAVAYQNSIPAGQFGIITYFDGRPEWSFWTDTYEIALSGSGDTVAFVTDIPIGPETEPLYVLERQGGAGPELIADHATDPSLSANGCRIAYVLDGAVQVDNRCV